MSFGETIKRLRKNKHLTLKDVSQEIGISIGYLCDIERGRKYPPPDTSTIHALEHILDITDASLEKMAIEERMMSSNYLTTKLKSLPNISRIISAMKQDITVLQKEEIERILGL